MTGPSLEALLARLRRGDETAAEELVAAYEPLLRGAVRGHLPDHLRAKLDSADVVQSVWARALPALRDGDWEVPDGARLRALLLTVARRRMISHYRHHRAALAREEPGGPAIDMLPAEGFPQPSEVARAGELWEQVLALCPPEHHRLLELRREGLTLDEIAERTGLHEGSVRRVIRQVSRRLALLQAPLAAANEVHRTQD
jgi:RNA polymerase sigma-70 factor (ECF subfamily)